VTLPAEILLTWDAVPDAQSYSVYRAGADRRWVPVASQLAVPRFRDTDFRELPSLYQIAARNDAGEVSTSPEITVSDVGQNIRLLGVNPRPLSDSAMVVSWNLLGSGDGLLEIGADPGNYDQIFWNSTPGVRQDFVISNLQPATTYFYRLTSASSMGDGVTYSSTFTTRPFTEPPPVSIPIPSPGVSVSTLEDTPLRMTIISQTQPLQVQITSQPLSGTLIEMFPDLVYVPNRAEAFYPDFFEITGTDGSANYLTRVMIDVQQAYDAPIANDQSLRFDENFGRRFHIDFRADQRRVNSPALRKCRHLSICA
jgi:hypothetical protein